MAWESRKGRGRYYYRTHRVEGRVVKEYVGCGPEAEAAAQLDVRVREAAKKAAFEAQAIRRRQLADEAVVKQFLTASADLLEEGLQKLGLYQHHRGEWRRRRGQHSR